MNPPRGFRVVEPGDDPSGKAGGPDPAATLAHVWADDIAFDLSKAGLIDGLLGTTGMAVLYGESGSGKTFVALDIACHVAAGMAWRGMDVEQGVVIYVAAESPESVQRRVWAWKRHHGVEHLPLVIVTAAVDLLNGSTDELIRLLAEVREKHGRVAFVVIDTLARAMMGNENAPDDMGKFVSSCGRVREACAGHVLIVHHTGKDTAKGARGHSCLRAATDVEMEVANGVVRVTKHRDEAGGRTFGFRLETVELGVNAKARVVTTCVAVETKVAPVTPVTPPPKLGPNERVTLDALAAALVDHPVEPPLTSDIPRNVKVTTVERWNEAAVRYLTQATLKEKNQAFKRAVKTLVAGRRVRHVSPDGEAGYVWLPAPRDGERAGTAGTTDASGHTGHTGHTGPDVTSCDRTESSGHTGHTGHTPLKGCDPCYPEPRRPDVGEGVGVGATGHVKPDVTSRDQEPSRFRL